MSNGESGTNDNGKPAGGPAGVLVSAVYVTSAIKPFGRQELLELLRHARRNNEAAGITGMLLYRSGNFIQAIEGPAEAVDRLLDRIALDPRHAGMIQVVRQPITRREFAAWSMAFDDISNRDLAGEPGFSDFLRRLEDGTASSDDAGIAMTMLRRFGQTNR
ncbi:MAG: BLUF domain-containing protein [Alphaproteobacteria bacterium]|nr:BLUF domain-containing protein [Alphaproteobacteria bacterium]